jgi:hypothetical protein
MRLWVTTRSPLSNARLRQTCDPVEPDDFVTAPPDEAVLSRASVHTERIKLISSVAVEPILYGVEVGFARADLAASG